MAFVSPIAAMTMTTVAGDCGAWSQTPWAPAAARSTAPGSDDNAGLVELGSRDGRRLPIRYERYLGIPPR